MVRSRTEKVLRQSSSTWAHGLRVAAVGRASSVAAAAATARREVLQGLQAMLRHAAWRARTARRVGRRHHGTCTGAAAARAATSARREGRMVRARVDARTSRWSIKGKRSSLLGTRTCEAGSRWWTGRDEAWRRGRQAGRVGCLWVLLLLRCSLLLLDMRIGRTRSSFLRRSGCRRGRRSSSQCDCTAATAQLLYPLARTLARLAGLDVGAIEPQASTVIARLLVTALDTSHVTRIARRLRYLAHLDAPLVGRRHDGPGALHAPRTGGVEVELRRSAAATAASSE